MENADKLLINTIKVINNKNNNNRLNYLLWSMTLKSNVIHRDQLRKEADRLLNRLTEIQFYSIISLQFKSSSSSSYFSRIYSSINDLT